MIVEASYLDKKEAHSKTESQPQNFRPRQTSGFGCHIVVDGLGKVSDLERSEVADKFQKVLER